MIRERLFPEPWMRWYDLPGLRRITLARWALTRKRKFYHRWRLAPFRHLYWVLSRGWDSEICGRCGGPVRVVFWTPDRIWTQITSLRRTPGGEAAGGILCIPCVDDLYDGPGGFLRWTCAEDDSLLEDPRMHTLAWSPEDDPTAIRAKSGLTDRKVVAYLWLAVHSNGPITVRGFESDKEPAIAHTEDVAAKQRPSKKRLP